jgi:hypothetical protein
MKHRVAEKQRHNKGEKEQEKRKGHKKQTEKEEMAIKMK